MANRRSINSNFTAMNGCLAWTVDPRKEVRETLPAVEHSTLARRMAEPAAAASGLDLAAAGPSSEPDAVSLDAGAVAAYLLQRRHLAAAFELYQDFLATSSVAGVREAGDDGDGGGEGGVGDARHALQAYFANPTMFPLADLQRYANAIDSKRPARLNTTFGCLAAPAYGVAGGGVGGIAGIGGDVDPPEHRGEALLARGGGGWWGWRCLYTLHLTNRISFSPAVPLLQATCKEQESRIRVAEYDLRVAEEDALERAAEPAAATTSACPIPHAFTLVAGAEELIRSAADHTSHSAGAAADGFLNRCGDALAGGGSGGGGGGGDLAPIADAERRILNVLVNEYLMARGYRATTLTLRDEAIGGQDMEDWSPLGLASTRGGGAAAEEEEEEGTSGGGGEVSVAPPPRPAGEGLRLVLRRAKTLEVLDPEKLVVLERSNAELTRGRAEAEAARAAAEERCAAAVAKEAAVVQQVSSLRLQRDEADVEAARWRARAEEAAATVKHMEENMGEWRAELEAQSAAVAAAAVATTFDATANGNAPAAPAASAATAAHSRSHSSVRWGSAGGGGLGALEAAAEEEATVRVLVDALPRVALHVLIQHRVELLPLFQRAIARCPVPQQRASTTALLFSLIKRPGPDQRRVLAEACANIAKVVGERRTAEELIPQCFEQVPPRPDPTSPGHQLPRPSPPWPSLPRPRLPPV